MRWNQYIIWLCLGLAFLLPLNAMACHKGGPMGFAKLYPGMLTADISYSPTYTSASTSGTSGCKNWDFVKLWKETQQQYVVVKWDQLSEEAARGSGTHLQGLAQLMGCPHQKHALFGIFLKTHYKSLFLTPLRSQQQSQQFLPTLQILLAQQKELAFSCLPPKNTS